MTIDTASLDAGEKILWQGKPNIDVYFRRRKTLVPQLWASLTALASGVALASLLYISGYSHAVLEGVAVVLFLAGALLLYVRSRFRRDARRLSYALTDKRAIIDSPGAVLPNRTSTPYSDIRTIDVRDGQHGDLLFRSYEVGTEHESWAPDGFFAIEDVRKVEHLLRSEVERNADKPHASVSP